MDYKSKAHQFLINKGVNSMSETFTANRIEEWLSEFAERCASADGESEVKSIHLQVGMRVKMKDYELNYQYKAGKVKTITKELPNFHNSRAFGLDGDDGFWLIDEFEYCIEHPYLRMT